LADFLFVLERDFVGDSLEAQVNPAIFLTCALAAAPVYIGNPRPRIAQAVYRILVPTAQQEGFLLHKSPRILIVTHTSKMRVSMRNMNALFSSVGGRLVIAPFRNSSFGMVWLRRPFLRSNLFYEQILELTRIVQEGGFVLVKHQASFENWLYRMGFMRIPFQYKEYRFYQYRPHLKKLEK
jgi:hypothetical protein